MAHLKVYQLHGCEARYFTTEAGQDTITTRSFLALQRVLTEHCHRRADHRGKTPVAIRHLIAFVMGGKGIFLFLSLSFSLRVSPIFFVDPYQPISLVPVVSSIISRWIVLYRLRLFSPFSQCS